MQYNTKYFICSVSLRDTSTKFVTNVLNSDRRKEIFGNKIDHQKTYEERVSSRRSESRSLESQPKSVSESRSEFRSLKVVSWSQFQSLLSKNLKKNAWITWLDNQFRILTAVSNTKGSFSGKWRISQFQFHVLPREGLPEKSYDGSHDSQGECSLTTRCNHVLDSYVTVHSVK